MKHFFRSIILLLLFSSCSNNNPTTTPAGASTFTLHSKKANDDFTIFVSLPKNYEANKGKVAVVYLLDANFYFDMVAPILKKYAEFGFPPVILVGIGYKNFRTMDSLRDRDFTFPAANASEDMRISGNGNNFLAFIEQELIPHIDATYPNDKNKRILMGHSLGGFFTVYALQQNLLHHTNTFSAYVAVSPSVDYNNHYLLNELNNMPAVNAANTKVYATFGSLEDAEENEPGRLPSNAMLLSLSTSLKDKHRLNYKGDMYSNFSHMETPLPSFLKGLDWILNSGE